MIQRAWFWHAHRCFLPGFDASSGHVAVTPSGRGQGSASAAALRIDGFGRGTAAERSLRSEESLALGVAPVVAAHDAFGFLQSDAACGTRTRCGSSGWPPLSPPSRQPFGPIAWLLARRRAVYFGCHRTAWPGREHAPIAAVGRRKKLERKMART